ncbi:MAG: ATP-dependent DNA ligase, partial [Methanobacteriota archaeon]
MEFARLVTYLEKLEGTASHTRMIAILAELLGECPADEIDIVCYFTLGSIAPGHSRIFLGMGESLVRSSIALAFDADESTVGQMKTVGDWGDVAYRLGGRKEAKFQDLFAFAPPLTVKDVHRGFMAIASASGAGAQETKIRILAAMLSGTGPRERRYLARLATGEMRLGAGEMTILDALADAFLGSKKERPPLEHAYNISSDIGLVAKTLKERGLSGVQAIGITLFRPIKPMLAQRVGRLEEILSKIPSGTVSVEEKYDGERIQAHKDGDRVRLFSRRLKDVTDQYPDIVGQVREHVHAPSAILDGEAVAYDLRRGTYYLFQQLMQRRRKYRVEEYVEKYPVRYMVFDLLYLKWESYLQRDYPARRARLEEIVQDSPLIAATDRLVTSDLDRIRQFFHACLARGLEGIVVKSCAQDSSYRAGSREWAWIKWKPSYGSELSDTLDLVVVGAYPGRGRRAGTYGSLLCAAYHDEKDIFQTVCKMGTGF